MKRPLKLVILFAHRLSRKQISSVGKFFNSQAPVHLQAKLTDQGQGSFQGEKLPSKCGLPIGIDSVALNHPEISQN